ncbi:histidinol-phosphatase [Paracoccus sp. (in: a-proteobacteria)]|uniref:histidinol-phosphatase n=1 Tax=Paracoccus sp. TaxID=267 RepID=UPI0026DEE5C1|nr:histidinol-phosphatase [Paracoccus sp. (in: a-proteobacteria)]MDO5647264.1 histidinol-phosphatase [Paracoccus sp. (in: a-proteobacteria)]
MDHSADIIRAAHDMADAAGRAILPLFRTGIDADNKRPADFDPVTQADRDAERAMRDVLARLRPDDAIFGEEYGHTPGTSGLTWILDPIDGTRAFLCGAPSWGVLIGLRDDQGMIYGVIDQPYMRERFQGGLGVARLTHPGGVRDLAVRRGVDLSHATLMTTFPEIGTPAEAAAFRRVADQVRLTRYGMDCYAYALLALGQVDLVIEAGLQSYDIAAPIAVIQAAGGIVTNWQGGPALDGGQVIAAATPELHQAAMALLNAD